MQITIWRSGLIIALCLRLRDQIGTCNRLLDRLLRSRLPPVLLSTIVSSSTITIAHLSLWRRSGRILHKRTWCLHVHAIHRRLQIAVGLRLQVRRLWSRRRWTLDGRLLILVLQIGLRNDGGSVRRDRRFGALGERSPRPSHTWSVHSAASTGPLIAYVVSSHSHAASI